MRGVRILVLVFLAASAVLTVASCDQLFLGEEGEMVSMEENLRPPPDLNDGLEVSTLEAVNIDPEIHELIRVFHENRMLNQRSFLVARHNKLVLEAYFNGWHRERLQDMRSSAKSVTSALVGIAIDKGYVGGVDEGIYSFFDEYNSFDNWAPLKEEMTIRDFLRMRTGLACNDRKGTAPASRERMYDHYDWVKLVLDAKISGVPGGDFHYCSGAPVVLGALVANASEKTIPEFAGQYLLEPLGIEDYAWEYMPSGRVDTGGHLHLRPRDMMKFGLLFLNRGTWNGKRLISQEWVEASTRADGRAEGFEYGYLWWVTTWRIEGREIPAYFARGNGGQLIFVIPSLDTVIVFTAGRYNENWLGPIMGNMKNRILPHIR